MAGSAPGQWVGAAGWATGATRFSRLARRTGARACGIVGAVGGSRSDIPRGNSHRARVAIPAALRNFAGGGVAIGSTSSRRSPVVWAGQEPPVLPRGGGRRCGSHLQRSPLNGSGFRRGKERRCGWRRCRPASLARSSATRTVVGRGKGIAGPAPSGGFGNSRPRLRQASCRSWWHSPTPEELFDDRTGVVDVPEVEQTQAAVSRWRSWRLVRMTGSMSRSDSSHSSFAFSMSPSSS